MLYQSYAARVDALEDASGCLPVLLETLQRLLDATAIHAGWPYKEAASIPGNPVLFPDDDGRR